MTTYFGDPDCGTCNFYKDEVDAWRSGQKASPGQPASGERYALNMRETIKSKCQEYRVHCLQEHKQIPHPLCDGLCESHNTPQLVTDCLGRTRATKAYPDGSYNCPFCWAAVNVDTPAFKALKCPNPACFALGGDGRSYPIETAQAVLEAVARKRQEDKEREDLRAWRETYAHEQAEEKRKEREQIIKTAEEKGACTPCALHSAKFGQTPKYIKHRKGCPRS